MCSLYLSDIYPMLVKSFYPGLPTQPVKSEPRPLAICVLCEFPGVRCHQASLGITGDGHGHRQ